MSFVYLWGSKSLNAAFANIFYSYARFIGIPHLKAIARLLQYQGRKNSTETRTQIAVLFSGIAVILEELLKMARLLVTEKLKRHLRAIYSVMPKLCKLPRSDYGSPGMSKFVHDIELAVCFFIKPNGAQHITITKLKIKLGWTVGTSIYRSLCSLIQNSEFTIICFLAGFAEAAHRWWGSSCIISCDSPI